MEYILKQNYSKLLVLLATRAETHMYLLILVPYTEHSFMKLVIVEKGNWGKEEK